MILRFIRIWLPVIVCVLGIVLFVRDPSVDTAMGSAGIIGAGLSIWLLNFLFRIGVKGDRERDEEDAARRFFTEHGYWPDEGPPPGATRPDPHDAPHHGGTPRHDPDPATTRRRR